MCYYPLSPASVVNGVNYTEIMRVFAKKNFERTGYEFKFENGFNAPTDAPKTVMDIVPQQMLTCLQFHAAKSKHDCVGCFVQSTS